MSIAFHEKSRTFHLYNDSFSYIIKILNEGLPVCLYYGSRIQDRESFDNLMERAARPMSVMWHDDDLTFSEEHARQEYPAPLHGDMRNGAIDLVQPNGSRIVEFVYTGHEIIDGKPGMDPLPACYVENEVEAKTLILFLQDELLGCTLELHYSIYENLPVICRHAVIRNDSDQTYRLERMMSLALDLPDDEWQRIVLAGAWARERNIEVSDLHTGSQSIYSLRGHSSHNYNPFLCLKRPWTTEQQGECLGFSLVYSGNFLADVDVNTWHTTRVTMGIHPHTFSWPLHGNDSFTTPEAVLVYSEEGLNAMSQTFHTLFQKRLARGVWRDQARPILINSWEGVYFDVKEEQIVDMAACAKDLGIEMFVLDDGWFKKRDNELSSLGDWSEDFDKLPSGIAGLAEKINDLDMKFGLWIEPEMISEDSDLFRTHPEWMLTTPGRRKTAGRFQYVLDFSNPEVVDAIASQLEKILDCRRIAYIKWDMNRSMSDVYSLAASSEEQGMIYHQYILGVYALYDRLTRRYPEILFESCASGGARFDPGMLYYAPQAWTSDDTDAVERLKIQYGTSMVYPISSMGSHVSAIPNHQLHRTTSLHMRSAVAYFGTFGYELDPLKLTESEKAEIREQVQFMKENRKLIQFGTFYRLRSPFEGNETAWMVTSADQSKAIVAYYRVLQQINAGFRRLKLEGLDPNALYEVRADHTKTRVIGGDQLMKAGLVISDSSSSENKDDNGQGDYLARLYELRKLDEVILQL